MINQEKQSKNQGNIWLYNQLIFAGFSLASYGQLLPLIGQKLIYIWGKKPGHNQAVGGRQEELER